MKIIIGHLYPDLMNIYGDIGNIYALKKRLEWRGIEVEVKNINGDHKLRTKECDLYFFGGGQDQSQNIVARLLSKNAKVLKSEIDRGVPLLAICGGYQLLGEYYKPHRGEKLEGVGIFPAYTVASSNRMIGNTVISSQLLVSSPEKDANHESRITNNLLVGFENHSGKTYLQKGAQPLGTVTKGFGNNGEDKLEGCIYKNAIGCYMHGSLLPKNPELADWLIKKAIEVKYGEKFELKPLDDTLETAAHQAAVQKFG